MLTALGRARALQVCVVVRNLKKAMEQYRTVFGIEDYKLYTVDTEELPGVTYRGQPGKYRVQVALARIGNWHLELIEHQGGESIYKEFVDKYGEGVQHLGFFVEDYPTAYKEMGDFGLKHLQGGPIQGENRTGHFDYFDSKDRLGVIVELLDIPDVIL